MRTTAVFNYKGGVGKTTTCINLGAELAADGKRVLLIDADGQCNLSEFFDADMEAGSLYEVLTGTEPYYENLIQATRWDRLAVLPSSDELATIELTALTGGEALRQNSIRDLCAALAEAAAFDCVLIDCPPSFSPQSLAALVAADDIIVPLTPDRFAVTGLRDVARSVAGARKINEGLCIAGVLLTMTDRTAVSRDAEAAVRESGFPVFGTTIHASAWARRMTFDRGPLREFCSWSTIALDYAALAKEYMGGAENG